MLVLRDWILDFLVPIERQPNQWVGLANLNEYDMFTTRWSGKVICTTDWLWKLSTLESASSLAFYFICCALPCCCLVSCFHDFFFVRVLWFSDDFSLFLLCSGSFGGLTANPTMIDWP